MAAGPEKSNVGNIYPVEEIHWTRETLKWDNFPLDDTVAPPKYASKTYG